jgi:hypothetical protein
MTRVTPLIPARGAALALLVGGPGASVLHAGVLAAVVP